MTDYKDIWHSLIEDEQKSWVVFANGTCVILMKPSADLAQQAKTLLSDYDTRVKTKASSGEFSVMELDILPGWVIGWHHPDILNYVAPDELFQGLPKDMQAGLIGRQHRQDDTKQLKIVYIYDPKAKSKK